jgi:predicted DNA-binding transcriptional regulator AlpA
MAKEVVTPVRGKLLTLNEAAEKIAMSSKWIYARMKEGNLPFPWYLLSSGKRAIDSADIDDWLSICKIPAGGGEGDEKRRNTKK